MKLTPAREACALLLGLALIPWLVGCSPPSRQGRPARDWLVDLDDTNPATRLEARKAIQAMGTNVIPLLAKDLGEPNSEFHSKVSKILSGTPLPPLPPDPAKAARRRAFDGLETIGPPAIPELLKLLNQPQTSRAAIELLRGLKDEAIPILTTCTTHSNAYVRMVAALDLGYRRMNSAGVADALIEMIRMDRAELNRSVAAEALSKIPDIPPRAIEAIINLLGDLNPAVVNSAIQSLGRIGPKATIAVPELTRLYHSHPKWTSIQLALQAIDPESGARLGFAHALAATSFE